MLEHPYWDRDDVHEIYRHWRTIADSYAGAPRLRRRGVGRRARTGWPATSEPTSCTPPSTSTSCGLVVDRAASAHDDRSTLAEHAAVGAPPTWVLSNHDVAREVSRYARPQTGSGCAPSTI